MNRKKQRHTEKKKTTAQNKEKHAKTAKLPTQF